MPNAELARLQALMVKAAITGSALPGIDRNLDFPDLAALRQSAEKYVSSENLEIPHELGVLADVLPQDGIAQKAVELGPFPFLRFQPPSQSGDRIGLSLQLMTGFDDVEPLALGAMVATFEKRGDGWIAVEPTHVLAY